MRQEILLTLLLLASSCYVAPESTTAQSVEGDWEPDPNLFEVQCAPAWFEYCWNGNNDCWGQRFHRTCFHPLRHFWEVVGPCACSGSYFPLDLPKETL